MPQLLPGDNPQACIPGDRRRSLARGSDLPAVTHGAGVFVDISGFTNLVAELAGELVADGVLVVTGEASPIASQSQALPRRTRPTRTTPTTSPPR